MPPIFHEDIAAVKKLQEELESLKKEYATLLEGVKKAMSETRSQINKTEKVTAEQAKTVEVLVNNYKNLSAQEQKVLGVTNNLIESEKDKLALDKQRDKEQKKYLENKAKEEKKIRDIIAASKMEIKSMEDLMKRTNALVALRKKLDLTTEAGIKEEIRLRTEIEKNTVTLKKYDAQIGRHQRSVGDYGIATQGMKTGMGQVFQAFKKNITVTNEYNQQITQTQTISQRVTNVSQGLRASWMGIAVVAGTVVAGVRKWVSMQSELSDAIADVQKTTGLTKLEVRGLNKELLQLNTRSSQKELLDLAYVAGKLGIKGVQDVLGFTRAADKIGVALGRELGNAEEAARVIGKLTDLFNLKQEFGLETAMTKIGSAINSLGQDRKSVV